MALTKVTYTDDVTVIEAQNINAIQDEIISLETVSLVAENSDLDTIQTPGRYRLWGAYTNAPKTGNMYGILTVEGISGALTQTYQSATATDSYFRGYTNSQWYSWRQFMLNSGGTFSGSVTIDRKDGTASTQGWSSLIVGNNIVTGTEGNSAGDLQIYGRTAYKTEFYSPSSSPTANRVITIPDASGTIMLDSGVPFTGNVNINLKNGTTSAVGDSILIIGNSTPSGTAQNSRGVLRLYGTGAYQANIYPQALTAVRNITLPDANGTIALDTVSSSTITNNTTYVLSGTSYLDKQAKVCVATISMRLSAFPAANTAYTVGTIPDGYRPKRITPFIAHSINSALTFLGQVETDGTVTLASMGQVNSTGLVNASVTWILA